MANMFILAFENAKKGGELDNIQKCAMENASHICIDREEKKGKFEMQKKQKIEQYFTLAF